MCTLAPVLRGPSGPSHPLTGRGGCSADVFWPLAFISLGFFFRFFFFGGAGDLKQAGVFIQVLLTAVCPGWGGRFQWGPAPHAGSDVRCYEFIYIYIYIIYCVFTRCVCRRFNTSHATILDFHSPDCCLSELRRESRELRFVTSRPVVPKLERPFSARQRAGLAVAWGTLFSGPRRVGAKGAGPNWQTCFPKNKRFPSDPCSVPSCPLLS